MKKSQPKIRIQISFECSYEGMKDLKHLDPVSTIVDAHLLLATLDEQIQNSIKEMIKNKSLQREINRRIGLSDEARELLRRQVNDALSDSEDWSSRIIANGNGGGGRSGNDQGG